MTDDAVARWSIGEHLVIAWPGGIALVEASVGLAAAEKIWNRMRQESQLGVFLKALSEGSEQGFLNLPSFGIAVWETKRCHTAVRGAVSVELMVEGNLIDLSGEGITTWAEKVTAAPEAVRLSTPGAGEPVAPILDGVVPAGGVAIGEFLSGHSVDVATDGQEMPLPAPPVEDLQIDAPPVEDLQIDAPPVEDLQIDDPPAEDPEVSDQVTLLEEDDAPNLQPASPNPYDSLWDQSIAIDLEAAALREQEESVQATPAADPTPAPLLGDSSPSEEQLSGETIVDEGVVEVSMPNSNLQVLARFCGRGHANPPERGTCFVCGEEVTGDARTTVRPPLGWLRIEGGETIPLKGPIIAGRNPQSSGLKLSETPRLVALPHPHVSGTHLAILIEGWRLMARDLRSSNGTYLRRHGKPPVRLPEAAVPLVPGDMIDLGKGLFLHLERTP